MCDTALRSEASGSPPRALLSLESLPVTLKISRVEISVELFFVLQQCPDFGSKAPTDPLTPSHLEMADRPTKHGGVAGRPRQIELPPGIRILLQHNNRFLHNSTYVYLR